MVTSRYASVMTVHWGYLYTIFNGFASGERFTSLSSVSLKLFLSKERAKNCFILHIRTFVVPVHTNINGSAPKWSRHNETSVWSFGTALVIIEWHRLDKVVRTKLIRIQLCTLCCEFGMVTSRYASVMAVHGWYLYTIFNGFASSERFTSLSAVSLKLLLSKERAKICLILHVRTFLVPVHTNINGSWPKWSRHN